MSIYSLEEGGAYLGEDGVTLLLEEDPVQGGGSSGVTRISQYTTGWANKGTTLATSSIAMQAGDVVVLLAGMESSTGFSVPNDPSTSNISWNYLNTFGSAGQTQIAAWVGYVGTAGTTATSLTIGNSSALEWGYSYTVWRGVTSASLAKVSVANNGTGSGAPAISIVTSASSAIETLVLDANLASQSGRVWRTVNGAAITEDVAYLDTRYGVYHGYAPNTGAAGTTVAGLTTPSTMRWTGVAVELKAA